MAYYTSVSLTRNTQAKAEDINTRTDAIQAGFEMLPNAHASAPSTKGFSEVFKIVDATGRDHPAAVGQIQDQGVVYAADSGSANTYAITLAPALAAYAAGVRVVMKAANANTGASTINVNALGAKAITKSGTTALAGGEITAGMIVSMEYDGTQFQIVGGYNTLTATMLDEDDMASDSAVNPATQQSIKAYVDNDVKTVAQGGTGVSTLADGGLVVGNAASAVEVVAAGLTTQILVGGGALTKPAWGTNIPTAVTIGSKYIYRADGTDVPVADGGTGASTLTDGGILIGSGTSAVTALGVGSLGQVPVSQGTGDPVYEYQPKQNLLTNSGFGPWSNSGGLYNTTGALPVSGDDYGLEPVDCCTDETTDTDNTTGWLSGSSAVLTSEAGGDTGNYLKVTEGGEANPYAYHALTGELVAGKLYQFSFKVKAGDEATYRAWVNDGGGGTHGYLTDTEATGAWVEHTFVFESTGTGSNILLTQRCGAAAGTYVMYDDVALHEVTPGCVAADTKGPDGWFKDDEADLTRMHSDGATEAVTKLGSFYAVKAVSASAGDRQLLAWPKDVADQAMYSRFAGRTMTFGAWVLTDGASQATLRFRDGTTTNTEANSTTAWEWVEVSQTINDTPTLFEVSFRVTAGKTVYISQPMLVFGSSIGEGNYQPIPNEVIWFETREILTDYNNITLSANATINLEAQSDGKVPKGIKAVHMDMRGSCGTAEKVLYLNNGSSGSAYGMTLYSQVIDGIANKIGFQKCDASGDIYIWRDATWNEVKLFITGVQL